MKNLKVFVSIALVFSSLMLSAKINRKKSSGAPGGGTSNYSIGPFDIYVSVQQPVNTAIFTGGLPASCDEGRVLDINVKNLQGPITVTPLNFHVNGPPCPTYDAHGKRTPANPPPNTVANLSGTIKVNAANIPAPGTTADAQFGLKDDGYWTKCSNGVKTQYPQVVTSLYKIHSLKLVLSPKPASVCKGTQTIIQVAEIYPATGGTITWQSMSGKIAITSSSNAKCSIDYVSSGDDVLVGTLTVGGATYRDSVKIKCGEVAFKQAKYCEFVVDDKIDLKTLLTDKSVKTDLEWKKSKNGGAGVDISASPIIDLKTYAPGDVEVVTVKWKNTTCEATATFKLFGLALDIPNNGVCDGAPLPFKVVVTPVDPDCPNLLATVGGLTPKSKTTVASLGNPAGTTVLEFEATGGVGNYKVKIMYWYSDVATNCNDLGRYKLWAEGTARGKALKTPEYNITADASGACVNGGASVTRTFTGVPNIQPGREAAGARRFYCYVSAQNTFARSPQGATTIDCHANSQYRTMIVAEENYHVGQIQGTNGVLCNALWLLANVYNAQLNVRYYGATQQEAIDNCTDAFWAARDAEVARSSALIVYPAALRCAVEAEAKAAVRSSHHAVMRCSYPRCP
ncbi:MAG: hypothetical protein NTX03_06335 [Bacteroidetes bacterium]|nr:hypothetical protein [Bacteroidota bacterium]